MPSVALTTLPQPARRPQPIALLPQGHGADGPAVAERRLIDEAEVAGRRLRRQFPSAESSPEHQPADHARTPAPAPLVARRPGAAPRPYTSPFMAQVIAQELMPREAREEPNFTTDGIAAYEATAARAAIYLGPQESLRLVA